MPCSDKGYQLQIQWYLTLDSLIQDILDLGNRDEDLVDEAFKQRTIRDIMNLFPEKTHLKLSKLPGKRREKLANSKSELKTDREDAQCTTTG